MTPRATVPLHVRACLALCAAVALWLAPAAARQRMPAAGVRAIVEHVSLDAARAPERVDAALRARPVTPARSAHGAAPFASAVSPWTPRFATRAIAPTSVAYDGHVPRARRLAFPTLATPPPRARA